MTFFLILAFLLTTLNLTAREVEIHGRVIHRDMLAFDDLLIVNARTGTGHFGKADGTFFIKAEKRDTILISVRGYHREIISIADSVDKAVYHIVVPLRRLTVEYSTPITIRPKVQLDDIARQQEKIDSYNHFIRPPSAADFLTSPISAIYEVFSKRAKEEREYYELLNEDAARNTLKAAIYFYIQNGLLYLDDQEITFFIDYCGLSRFFIKNATMYDLGEHIRDCYADFSSRQGY